MPNNNLRETKQRFSLRKNKKYKNLVSVGLGLFITTAVGVAGNEAKASEVEQPIVVTTENPATNSPEAQPEITAEATSNLVKKGEEIKNVYATIDKTNLEKAIENAENNGIKIEAGEKQSLGTATTIEEARKLQEQAQQEINKQTEQINQKVDEYKTEVNNYEVEVNKILEENLKSKTKYEEELAEYNKKKEEFDKAMANAEENKTKDGYLSEVISQSLVYANEPNANVEIDAGNNKITYNSNLTLSTNYSGPGYYINYIGNEPIIATYTNLQNSFYDGKTIKKVTYEIKRETLGNNPISLYILKNPTSGLSFGSKDPLQEVSIKIRMYDNSDNIINFTENAPALIGISSITTNYFPNDSQKYWREIIKDYNFDFVKISGSSVEEHSNGIYSLNDNKFKEYGSRYTHEEADYEGSPYYWWLGGAGKISSGNTISMTFFSQVRTHSQFWMSINTKIATSSEIPLKPTKPKEPKYKEIPNSPKAPTLQINEFSYEISPEITVEPKKENTDKNGVNIDGKTVLAGSVNYYKLIWDLDQYKGIKASSEDIAKGFYFIEDYPEEALTVNADGVTLVTADGKAVDGVKVELVESLDKASEEVKSIFAKSGIAPKGAFQLFAAINPEQFYNDYVAKGTSINIVSPMTVKNTFNGDYENKAYQVDFGNGYETELVINNVPKVEPKKENTDKNGVNIDGKTLLPNTVNYYKLLWDLDQYKGIKASKEDVSKGFYYIDDYPEEALIVNSDGVTLVTADGKAVDGVKVELVESLDKASEEVKSTFAKSGIAPKGAFQLFTAVNPEQFYNDYVATGTSINIVSPMTVKKEMINVGGEYENKAYQVDFGNGYETEVVVNNTPKITPEKDVVVDLSNSDKSLDGKTIGLNTVFNYRLTGGLVPSNRADEITQYGFIDDYDQKGDQYDGVYMAFANVDITLNDGTVVKKGTEITKYTTQNVDTKDGKVTIGVDKQFLTTVSKDSEFQVDVYLQMKRISVGEFENTFVNTINGVETISNTVKTNTPEPVKPEVPEQPKEEKPKPEVPKIKKELPKTNSVKTKQENSIKNNALAGVLALGILTMVRKRKVG